MRILKILAAASAILFVGCPVPSSTVALTSDPTVVTPLSETTSIEKVVRQTLQKNLAQRGLSVDTHGAWQVLHGVLAYGKDFDVQTESGPQPAVKYLLDGGLLDGFTPRAGDVFGDPPRRGVSVQLEPESKIGQGHRDQWLAVLVQSQLNDDDELRTPDGTFTIRDWINQTQYDVPMNLETEFSWTLIALTALDSTDATWVARDGETYSTELLVQSEVHEYQQSAQSGACGGTHRLIGIAMALNRHRADGGTISGVWADAEQVIESAIKTAQQNQNPDGSYSPSYFHRPGWTRDLGESLGTTGHVLEFLALAAPDETLRQPWVQRTVRRLCEILDRCEGIDLECGVLYHALHGLAEYEARITADNFSPANSSGNSPSTD